MEEELNELNEEDIIMDTLRSITTELNKSDRSLDVIKNNINNCMLDNIISQSEDFLSQLDSIHIHYTLSGSALSGIIEDSAASIIKKSIIRRIKEQKKEFIELNSLISKNCICSKR